MSQELVEKPLLENHSEDESSSTEFEKIGHNMALVAPINCVVSFAEPKHGHAFLKRVATAVATHNKRIKVLNPNHKFVVLSGDREHIDALVRFDKKKLEVAYLETK
ncbi:MAG: hypothetical protein WD512_17860 [Candidatus Paceibacterota bacterium]